MAKTACIRPDPVLMGVYVPNLAERVECFFVKDR